MRNRKTLTKRIAVYAFSLLLIVIPFSSPAHGQVTATGRINGTVTDPQGAVIPNAEVVVKNDETGAEYKTKTSDNGSFTVPSLPVAIYTVTVTAKGFKQTVITNVKTELGTTATVEAKLEVGATSETVTVTSGAEVLQKESSAVSTTITGRQITELPFTSRDALDLVLNLPGTQTPGRPRTSSVNGLPKSALNISLDGINVQDNVLRSSDGFFTYIRPRIDAIEEVQVSTATPGAESSAQGAVHIKFVTKSGTNEFHGGVWEYHRNPALNSNFYFNKINRIRDPKNPNCDPATPGCLVETPRARVLLNQFGAKVGGPIIIPKLFNGRDKAFFFVSYDEFRLPEQQVRTRTILSPDAERGIFKYPGGPAGGVNLLALAASKGFPGTFDPTVQKIIADMRASTSQGAVVNTTDPNVQLFTFTNTGGQTRRFPTVRFDFNVTSNHHIEAIYNYQDFASTVDFLNGRDPAFPAPVPRIIGSQGSDRFSFTTALRSQLSPVLVNEARFGLVGGTVVFFPEVGPGSFAPFGGVAPVFTTIISNPYTGTTNSRRNSPLQQFSDTLSWVKDKHNFNFGFTFSRNTLFSQSSGGQLVPTINFGINTTDPAINVFTNTGSSATLPGADATQLARARFLYAMLTGRVTAVNFNAKLDEKTKKYTLDGTSIGRQLRKEFGLYAQDSFKFRPNLTLNYGVRWEPVLAPRHTNGVYTRTTFAGLFGISGPGNLFKPGASDGSPTQYFAVSDKDKPYRDDYNNVSPSIGFAWSPKVSLPILKAIFGEGDKTVLRGGYSMSY
ncbi:MAG TPA: TonB-dependent receptor, partial [Blastocatellia bacterium]|nr:TonB-dependent receptor [Blastocatellia bacterium]